MWVRAVRKRILPEFVATTKQLLTWSNSTKLRSGKCGKVWLQTKQALVMAKTWVHHCPSLFSLLDLLYCCLISLPPTEAYLSRRLMHTRQWDAGGDSFDSLCGIGILEVADLSSLISPTWWAWIARCVFLVWVICGLMLWMRMKQMRNRNLMWAWMPFITFLYLRIWELRLETCCSVIIELKYLSRLQCFIVISVLICVIVFLFLNSKAYPRIGFFRKLPYPHFHIRAA